MVVVCLVVVRGNSDKIVAKHVLSVLSVLIAEIICLHVFTAPL